MSTSSMSAAQTTLKKRYYAGAQAMAELAAFLFWLFTWTMDGLFTVLYLTSWGMPVWGGIIWHLVQSLIQQHLWRSRRRSAYPLVVAVGAFNVYTSALGLLFWIGAYIPMSGLALLGVVTVIAEGMAMLPEPQLVDHGAALLALRKRKKEADE